MAHHQCMAHPVRSVRQVDRDVAATLVPRRRLLAGAASLAGQSGQGGAHACHDPGSGAGRRPAGAHGGEANGASHPTGKSSQLTSRRSQYLAVVIGGVDLVKQTAQEKETSMKNSSILSLMRMGPDLSRPAGGGV